MTTTPPRAVNAPPRTIRSIAADILVEWTPAKVNCAAKPFLDTMHNLDEITDTYGANDAEYVVLQFLSNASQFKGARARELKEELRAKLPKRR